MELRLNHITKKYSKVIALDDVSFSLKTGIYALLGHNGAGKTTLLEILATLIKADNGQVLLDGVDVQKLDRQYREILGYMPQQQTLIPYMSVTSFLRYMAVLKGINKEVIETKIQQLLVQTNLIDKQHEKLSYLSGGMKQRVLVAQALLNDPKILLLDEPTAGLDPVERRSFRELIAQVAVDKIVILATHVISDVEWIANQIVIMKQGKILTIATQEQLLEETKVYESTEEIADLLSRDPKLKVVNQIRLGDEIKIRFISKQNYNNPVSTTLDDVYLDWLG